MKIEALIEQLQEIAESNPGAEVMLATQPSYPLAERLRGVASPDDDNGDDPDADEDSPDRAANVVWLVSGGQSSDHNISPYAPRWVFDAVR